VVEVNSTTLTSTLGAPRAPLSLRDGDLCCSVTALREP
jgi:hypothetical protein